MTPTPTRDVVDRTLDRLARPATAPPRVRLLLWVLLAIGIASIAVLAVRAPKALWAGYLANFLLFTGLAQDGVLWSAVTRGCNARWARPLQRLAESLSILLPVSVVLFIPLMCAHSYIYTWWGLSPAPKAPWLSHAFLLSRDLGILIFMAWLSLDYLFRSLRPDLAAVVGDRTAPWWKRWCVRNWRGLEAERARRERHLSHRWVWVVFAFCYLYSILGIDLNLALNIHWYNYIYGWYFFISTWYSGLALISILAVVWRNRLLVRDIITADILHDQGEVMFGFTIFWAYLFWAQFMVLWYANRQDDITVLLRLSRERPWDTLSWITLTLAFFLPFGFGLSRSFKRRGATLAMIACFSLAGIWLEHNLIVDVSIWGAGYPPLVASGGVTCFFLGLYGLLYLAFLERVPAFPVQDAWMAEALVIHPQRH